MESIVFRWQANAKTADSVEWVTVDADGRPHISTKNGSLHDLARQLNNSTPKKQAIFLLSADYYSLHQVTLPPKLSTNNIKKAAPYAIEDELVDAIDDYHFACGNIDKSEIATSAYIAALNKSAFNRLMTTLHEHNIKPKAVYAENMLLPQNSAESIIYIENDILHTRLDSGLAHSLPLNLLSNVIDDFGNERPIKIMSQNDLDSPLLMDDIECELMNTSLLSVLAKQLHQHKPFNLLQGEFKYQEEIGKHIKPWRWPLGLAAAALVIAFIGQLLLLNQLEQQNLELEEEKVAIYKSTFPKSRNIDAYTVRTRMEQAVKKAGGNTGKSSYFIPLLQAYSEVITKDNAVSINTVDYSKDKLSLTLLAKDIQVLDQIKINLENKKQIIANILSSKTVTDGVEATLKLELR